MWYGPDMYQGAAARRYTNPTPIQAQALPAALSGRDILVGPHTKKALVLLLLFASMLRCGALCLEGLQGQVVQSVCCDAAVKGCPCGSHDSALAPSSPRAPSHSSR